ncbi:hypothetical protein GOP47_0023188 [Adiantum capillus-veneris]|uniref:Uncharacterized protein n=1 Tax=Adiantum capillus-veneris TaxID=13818 RepID=A0A9D4Z616_ADICA|nr:hypothetical protein GOP47_0023188 [Adiantum capillus-veneris]
MSPKFDPFTRKYITYPYILHLVTYTSKKVAMLRLHRSRLWSIDSICKCRLMLGTLCSLARRGWPCSCSSDGLCLLPRMLHAIYVTQKRQNWLMVLLECSSWSCGMPSSIGW